ncbi:MAG: glycerol-3-phosphate 1-O-acyltransferase PlsY [Clostridiales bacterium]|nr:glycerol-3-phosphate 1-O-acyltransferase PlsY [Clostridiales bacterium]
MPTTVSSLASKEAIISIVLIAVISYLLGSLNFGVILSRKMQNDDVRNHGSGNAGTTNMLRNYGKKIAALTIIGDMAKVAVAILIAFLILNTFGIRDSLTSIFDDNTDIIIKSFAGFFCVLGHIFPCFFKFKGGKGVATSGGMVFMIDWRIALILLAVFIIIVIFTKYVSLGSIIMAILYPICIFIVYKNVILTVIAVIFMLIVIIAHRENIVKLIKHKENKISFKSKK